MTRDTLGDVGNLALRLVTGGLMLFHGADKLMHGLDHVRSDLAAAGLPTALAHGVYVGEILAPICIIFGLWTRVSAVVYAGSIALAVARDEEGTAVPALLQSHFEVHPSVDATPCGRMPAVDNERPGGFRGTLFSSLRFVSSSPGLGER